MTMMIMAKYQIIIGDLFLPPSPWPCFHVKIAWREKNQGSVRSASLCSGWILMSEASEPEVRRQSDNVKFDQMNDQRLWCSGSRLPIKWVNLSPSRRRSRESKTLKRKGQYVRLAECQITQSTLKWEWFVCWQDFLFGDCVRVHQRRQEWRKNDVTPFKL